MLVRKELQKQLKVLNSLQMRRESLEDRLVNTGQIHLTHTSESNDCSHVNAHLKTVNHEDSWSLG